MKMRPILLLLSLLYISTTYAHDESKSNVGAVLNKDGSIVTDVLAPIFNPSAFELPFPHNLLFNGTADFTIAISGADPNNYSDPLTALGAMDGFSPIEKWVVSFRDRMLGTGNIDPSTVFPGGHSVRVFQVTTQQIFFVTGIVRELVAGVDYIAQVIAPGVVGIIPLKPLAEYQSYMVVLTNDIKDAAGNDATPDQTYHLSKSHDPWVDATGQSTTPLLDDATAQGLEGLRRITGTMEAAAGAAGIAHEDIVLSYTVQTQSITPSIKILRSIAQPGPTVVGFTGLNTSAAGLAGIADIYAGVITIPYFLGIPSAENPTAAITDFWTAPPGGYLPPFDQFGLDPTSTHVTALNPIPVPTGTQTIPILITVPNAMSGMSKPDGGWPVVIHGHGLGSNRTSLLAMADTLAQIGYVGVAIDFPLHGIVPRPGSPLNQFYIENTPFAPIANERTFDMDLQNNDTGAPGPDGNIDSSGAWMLNFGSLLTARDNFREGAVDLSSLAVTVPTIDIDSDGFPDLNGGNMAYVGISLGSIIGTPFTAVEPLISRSVLSVPAGGLLRAGAASPAFQPLILGFLERAGIEPGSAEFEQALTLSQTLVDSGDAINWSVEAGASGPVLLQEVIGDLVLPNFVPTAPLSGTEPMIAAMGLSSYSTSQANPGGLSLAGRFVPPAEHASLLSPTASLTATIEMQGQMASFIASFGTLVNVTNESTMVQVLGLSEMLFEQPARNQGAGKKGRSPGIPIGGPTRVTASPFTPREGLNND